jgi:RNA polymerase sigma-70 factor, ECF subfamily
MGGFATNNCPGRLPDEKPPVIFMNASVLFRNQSNSMYADATYGMEYPIPFFETPVAQTEQHLIERCKSGEAIALCALYEQHRSAVYRLTARMIDNDADREEVVQDVFLQVFKSVGRFKGQSKLKTWIHRIAMNVILQHIRKKKHRIRLQLTDTPSEERLAAENPQLTPEDAAVSLEKRAAVQRALNTLSPKKRAVLVLHDFEGVPANEIAKIVRTSVMTVRTRLFYAREGFYQTLASDPSFTDILGKEGGGA